MALKATALLLATARTLPLLPTAPVLAQGNHAAIPGCPVSLRCTSA